MPAGRLYPRFAELSLVEALADTPVVLIHGPRQCGKTTLAQVAGRKRSYAYFSFDDDVTLAAATADPVGFVTDLPERVILDEVQRAHEEEMRFHHYRDRDGAEVDLVLERGAGQIAGVEVKASATVTAADFRGLRKLKDVAGKRFAAGVVLYDGETSVGFGDGLYAVAIRALWEMT